jgi:ATP-dependent RNA helicase SUPV3L1/SUV3
VGGDKLTLWLATLSVTANLRGMGSRDSLAVKAVLGPTNTGKTYLAIERLCGHASGMMGFPLRLLAREVYDRVVAIKGPKEVGLITGEEKIMPPGARWLLCTAESMPRDRDCAFVALDEAQLGADPERGHIFTDRMLNVRGREETMILGSESLRPMIRHLLPEAEIIKRPRFSTLSYAGAKKLSRLPKRSAIVAFSAEEVYAVAEMLRRARGGAAVVMGALSPRTRNAQVAMYQAGDVDYLVATDAIGMGLNMDIDHVAFASLNKFDGRRQRRLTIAEMAQIAGRAGRHQKDGTFGSLGSEEGSAAFRPEEIEAIEEHRFPTLDHLYWRDGDPDLSSVDALIAALEAKPTEPGLRAAPEAIDLSVIKRLAEDPMIRDRAREPAMVKRLWAACSLPDFRKVGADHHARTVQRVFRHLSENNHYIPIFWFADELARLDRVEGDIDTLGGRIAAVRTWSYIAQRPDWLADPSHWAARAQELETKLSDALHARLTERFVDRRTAVLMRDVGHDTALFDVVVADDGQVLVEDEAIGRLDGFAFTVDPAARTGDRKRLLAAAERRLPKERARRAKALVAATDDAFALTDDPIGISWNGYIVARFAAGRTLTEPCLRAEPVLDTLEQRDREAVMARLEGWFDAAIRRALAPLLAMTQSASDLFTPARVRALLAPLAAGGGVAARGDIETALEALDPDDRRIMRRAGLTVGTLDLYDSRLLKPEPLRMIAMLQAIRAKTPLPPLPPPGTTVTALADPIPGYRAFGSKQVRIDLVERVARAVHDARKDKAGFIPDPALATSFGIDAATFATILRACGFRISPEGRWTWRSRPRPRAELPKPKSRAFAALEGWQG